MTYNFVQLSDKSVRLPLKLLIERDKGNVLFFTGAGISASTGIQKTEDDSFQDLLPNFPGLVLKVYQQLEPSMFNALMHLKKHGYERTLKALPLSDDRIAELKAFSENNYDVCLGMLEQRIVFGPKEDSLIRHALDDILAKDKKGNAFLPGSIHYDLIKLANRFNDTRIITTNFDCLLEQAATKSKHNYVSHVTGTLPIPSTHRNFKGIMHLHGKIPSEKNEIRAPVILTDQDFGRYYALQNNIQQFIYNCSRLFHIVFVGYSVNDPPMRYLLNGIQSDRTHHPDLKQSYIIINDDEKNRCQLEEWNYRGITPIFYDTPEDNTGILRHDALAYTIKDWAESLHYPFDKRSGKWLINNLKQICCKNPAQCSDQELSLFNYIVNHRHTTDKNFDLTNIFDKLSISVDWLDILVANFFSEETEKYETNQNVAYIIRSLIQNNLENPEYIKWAVNPYSRDKDLKEALKLYPF